MGYIPDDSDINLNFELVDYSNYNIDNIEPPTPPPLPPRPLTPLPLSLPPTPEPEISKFDKLPMEVCKKILKIKISSL